MIDLDGADDILNDDDDNGYDEDDNHYNPENSLKPDLSMLDANGDLHDLKDPDQVNDLVEELKEARFKLHNGKLKTYEGKSTDWGGGGRSRLLYDQVRVDLASDYHSGKNDMSWQEQHEEAMQVVKIVAVKNRNKFNI